MLSFLNNQDVISSDGIILLGDIFDLMIGPHTQYFERFARFFEIIKELIKNKKKIFYVEGNHDFHLKMLYKIFFQINNHLDSSLFQMSTEIILKDNNKSIFMAHGDDVELGNIGQKLFKSTVTSKPLELYANYLMPYFLITKIGEKSSEISRNRNQSRYSTEYDMSDIKENFRQSAEKFIKRNRHDIIVLGHSHVQDHYKSDNGFEYVNNGYAQHSKSYISINNGIISFKKI
jgi:UDP-2,3-diacylglucosamine hydrolase